MSSTISRFSLLVFLSSLVLNGSNLPSGLMQWEPKVPGGIGVAERGMIQGKHERYSYTPVASKGGYRASNFGQRWTTAFDGSGFAVEPLDRSWRWGLRLHRYGLRGDEQPCEHAVRLEPRRNGLVYTWDNNLEEWFLNEAGGLEHGFTVHRRPSGGGEWLQLRMVVQGDLRGVVQEGRRAIAFVNDAGQSVVHYGGLRAWDASGRQLRAEFQGEGDYGLLIEVDVRGAQYPLTIDPWAQQAYLKASNTGAGDWFGWAAALSGDTLVVGAPNEDSSATGVNGNQSNNGATDSGAVYVFVRTGGVWSQQAYLKASNTDSTPGASADGFGFSVAIHGDTIVVGAPGESSSAIGVNGDQSNNNAASSGAAYVFVRNAGTWSQQAYLKPSNTAQFQNFGRAVGVSGNTIVVGAPYEDSIATGVNGNQTSSDAPDSGAVYVFVRNGVVWGQQAYLKASNTGAFDHFGESLSISGETIAVGAPYEDSGATGINGDAGRNDSLESGAVYVFVRNSGQWSQQAYLKASNTGAGDMFGFRVALSAETLVAGAPTEDSSATGINGVQNDEGRLDSGAAYVFVRSGNAWSQQAYLKASNADAADYFGGDVAISGDTIVVGAEDEDGSGTGEGNNSILGAGAAYVFVRSGSVWSQGSYLKASNPGSDDEFGWVVGVSGDTVVAAAAGESSAATGVNGNQGDNSAPGAGAVYVFGSTAASGGLRFVPMTPCRLVDTRPVYAGSRTGSFGPPALSAGVTRTIPITSSTMCAVPASAKAYVFNVTLDTFYDQTGPVDFVTVWPTGESRPDYYTARTTTGGYIANAAIVKAGTNGAVDVLASQSVNLILDINGYFTDDLSVGGLLYYPVNPCRAVDTRGPIYSSLPPPYGNQRMQARDNRSFRLPGSPACTLPAVAAYSMQLTLAPGELTNGAPVAFLTAYPTGVAQPNISNMNSIFGYAVANSAIVPASTSGSIDVFAYDATNLIVDINGYFGPDDGSGRGLYYFPTRQCRVMNTQEVTLTGSFGGPAMSPGADRTVPIPAGRCAGLPETAKAWALNVWVAPNGAGMPYLSMWPSGTAWPNISQLNAFQGQTVANSGIVPASSIGWIDIRVAGPTHVALEVAGYFAR
ncbi:MAG: FG-GAP repeat protein [Bryobacteraceae bacterium]